MDITANMICFYFVQMDDLARKRRQLILKAAGLAAVLGAYMVFISLAVVVMLLGHDYT